MGKVHKSSDSECYTPSSESCRSYLFVYLELCSSITKVLLIGLCVISSCLPTLGENLMAPMLCSTNYELIMQFLLPLFASSLSFSVQILYPKPFSQIPTKFYLVCVRFVIQNILQSKSRALRLPNCTVW
jgi:hypothetical protein